MTIPSSVSPVIDPRFSIFSLCSSSMPVRAAYTLLIVSETPWMSSSRQASGTTIL